jgi:uncharacterized protein YbjT (DUF2867 family)
MSAKPIKVIITGATGMVGEGALFECLKDPLVERVLLLSRKSYGASLPKTEECLVEDFFRVDQYAGRLKGFDACFFCAGVSSIGKSEADYTRVTFDLTLHVAKLLQSLNPNMVFVYVSGASTDSSEQGKSMWARVKGRTENALTRVGFKAAYNFRPGFMKPTSGQKKVPGLYQALAWLYYLLRVLTPNHVSTLSDVARAMICVATVGYSKTILEVQDLNHLAGRSR